jgi:hypothetical protein
MPQREAVGLLFHSDYKERLKERVSKETLLLWQQYEVDAIKYAPAGYPYSASTSLFSVFRYLAEIYLKENKQMTFFASTHYNSWISMLDITKYSREKPQFLRRWDLPLLTTKGIKKALGSINIPQEWYNNLDLKIWQGSPGLFYDTLLLRILTNSPNSKADFVKISNEERITAVKYFEAQLNDQKLNIKVLKLSKKV